MNRFQLALAACVLTSLALASSAGAAELSPDDRKFLTHYDAVLTALAADDLAEAKTAATAMGETGAPLAQSESIADARKEFATLSAQALKLSEGQEGYYHVNCPMLKKDWVQTSTTIANPYAGSSMLTCGVIKK